jgi:hypothetical protein
MLSRGRHIASGTRNCWRQPPNLCPPHRLPGAKGPMADAAMFDVRRRQKCEPELCQSCVTYPSNPGSTPSFTGTPRGTTLLREVAEPRMCWDDSVCDQRVKGINLQSCSFNVTALTQINLGRRFFGPLRKNLRPFGPARGHRRGHRKFSSAWTTGTWNWRRRPDLNYVALLREDNVRQGFFEEHQHRPVLQHLPEELRPVV